MILNSHSLSDTQNFARSFLQKLKPKEGAGTVLALSGDLGSGKTTFTQFLAKELGVKDQLTSPTFVIEKKYQCGSGQEFKNLIHLDCYRLNDSSELLRLDWLEIINKPENLIVIEWPERVADLLPPDTLKLSFYFINENERRVEFVV